MRSAVSQPTQSVVIPGSTREKFNTYKIISARGHYENVYNGNLFVDFLKTWVGFNFKSRNCHTFKLGKINKLLLLIGPTFKFGKFGENQQFSICNIIAKAPFACSSDLVVPLLIFIKKTTYVLNYGDG